MPSGGIGPAAPAAPDIGSPSTGLLPRCLRPARPVATASPAAGLTIYNSTASKLNTWNGPSWDAALSATTRQAFPGATRPFDYTGGPPTCAVPASVKSLVVSGNQGAGGALTLGAPLAATQGRRWLPWPQCPAKCSCCPGEGVDGDGRNEAATSTPGGYSGGGSGYAVGEAGAVNGLLRPDDPGRVSAAPPGPDYLTPAGAANGPTLASGAIRGSSSPTGGRRDTFRKK